MILTDPSLSLGSIKVISIDVFKDFFFDMVLRVVILLWREELRIDDDVTRNESRTWRISRDFANVVAM